MATDVLAEKFESRLHLTTKTVGEDRIKKAKENNEDVAVLSTFLPSPDDGKSKSAFECALKEGCLLGDPKKVVAGRIVWYKLHKSCGRSRVTNLEGDCLVDKSGRLNLSGLSLKVKYMCITQYTLRS
jgi:hypothetical protein